MKIYLKTITLFIFLTIYCNDSFGQFTYGTTGLLHMPTAEMQDDKTFMFGGGYLNKQATPDRWYYDTWNYYINITFFPWLEVGYTCTVFDEIIIRKGPIHMINQDRNFSGRLRLWKEGWWKEWTPQIVVGGNDVLHGSARGGEIGSVTDGSNTFYQRFYIAASKHLRWKGNWGIHTAYVYSKRNGHKFNGIALGADYTFSLNETSSFNRIINRIKLMTEYDSKHINIGAQYTFWKDHINLIAELKECKYPSIGIYFKVHL